MSETGTGVRCEIDAGGLLTVWFDAAGRPVNTLTAAAWDGLDTALDRIDADRPVGVVLASAKPRSFIAGADLFELRGLADEALEAHLARGQRILDRLAALPMPTVAALDGDALGGGLEVALACRLRVAADDPTVKLGLPETTLGLVPGWGGTIRLPRLVGLEAALALLVPGKTIPPAEAARIGLVDRLASRADLLAAARSLALAPAAPPRRLIAFDPVERHSICERFRRLTRDRSGAHLPAPLRLIDVVEIGCDAGPAAGAAAERRALVELRATPASKNQLRLFFLRTAAKKAAVAAAAGTPRSVHAAAVIGGGAMGAGIAAALATAGIGVHVVEADERSAAAARPRLAAAGAAAVPVTTDWSAVAAADLVVEAVVEAGPVKHDVFRRLDEIARPTAILATNTSSLSVAGIAERVRDPGRVIGLHFFNPVAKMPLVEVVQPPAAAADAVATGVAVATTVGKTPVVCRDAPGFVVNRVLFPYLHATLTAATTADDVAAIDAAARAWGMPTGPFALLDEIGLDVAAAIFASLSEPLGPRLAPPPALAAAIAAGCLGRKTGRGFYLHDPAGGRPAPHPAAAAWLGAAAPPGPPFTAADFEPRLVAPMAEEARRVLAEGIVASADAIDLATVLGCGFPAFRGGLATWAGLAAPHGA